MNTIRIIITTVLSFCGALSFAQARSYSDFELTDLSTKYVISGARATVRGRTDLNFQMKQAGQFFFHFSGTISKAALDGKEIGLTQLTREIPIGSRSALHVLRMQFAPGETHVLSLQYEVDASQFRVKAFDGEPVVTFGTRYENAEGVGPEAIMPSLNRPAAKPKLAIEIGFTSAAEAKLYKPFCHCLMSSTDNGYTFGFPDTPTLQAYFGVAPVAANQPNRQFEVSGINVYVTLSADGFASSDTDRNAAFQNAEAIVRETIPKMEATFGKYQHGSDLKIFLFAPYGTSMEYKGAVQSTPILLRHELMHQWFATALAPLEYRDIWLNEAITVWLRKKLFNEDESWNGTVPALTETSSPFNLAGAPAFFEGYSREVYTQGPAFLNLADEILKRESNGQISLLAVIQEYYKLNVGKQISTKTFVQLLDSKSNYRWTPLFKKLIYGKE